MGRWSQAKRRGGRGASQAAPPPADELLYSEEGPATFGRQFGSTYDPWVGEFTMPATGIVHRIDFKTQRIAPGVGNVRAILYANGTGTPGAELGRSSDYPTSSLPAAEDWFTFEGLNVTLTGGQTYWVGYEVDHQGYNQCEARFQQEGLKHSAGLTWPGGPWGIDGTLGNILVKLWGIPGA